MCMDGEQIRNTDLALTAFCYGLALGLETTRGEDLTDRKTEERIFEKVCSIVSKVSALAPYEGLGEDRASLYVSMLPDISQLLEKWHFIEDDQGEGIISREKIGKITDEDQKRLDILSAICKKTEGGR